jgi:DNA mismatch repair ATPase MutS
MDLRKVADNKLADFQSEGFRNLFTMLQRELDDRYFAEVRAHLSDLKSWDGTLVSATLGNYMQGVRYVFRRKNHKGFWWRWRFSPSYTIAARDDAGAIDLGKRRDRAINEATNALAQAAEHLESFFAMLRGELAFYVGCLNLADRLRNLGLPTCIPHLLPPDSKARSWKGLYDISLALAKDASVVGNELDVTDKRLYIITGANQGGKSTFLRSLGQAQLMAQSGMFVGADRFSAPVRLGIFSHFKKEEDTAMKSGKLDEELARMSEIADHLEGGALILFNESFAATNEREGSEICRQITKALIDNNVEVFSVTHLYTYATAFLGDHKTQYLRAQRLENGERTFKVVPGEPLQTAFGEDLYQRIFEKAIGNR